MAQTSGAKIPIRWTAPEALEHARYGESSDVWSFGITVIELFLNGKEPYRGWQNGYVGERVLGGHVHPCPEDCPQSLYNSAIKPCLRAVSSDRPRFAELVARLVMAMESTQATPASDDLDGYLDVGGDGSSRVSPRYVEDRLPSAGFVTIFTKMI